MEDALSLDQTGPYIKPEKARDWWLSEKPWLHILTLQGTVEASWVVTESLHNS